MNAPKGPEAAPRPCLLVVDNELTYCQVIAKRLSAEGFDVVTATSGDEALARLATDQVFDCILLDVVMPDKGGYAVYREIRARPNAKTTPIIFLTVTAEEQQWEPLPEPGERWAFVTGKPITHQVLVERIRALISQAQSNG